MGIAAEGVAFWRGYVKSRYGQMHFYCAAPEDPEAVSRAPLLGLHQSPTTGISYREFQLVMARDRLVICPDTAGYGSSDGPATIPTIADYGAALVEALTELGFGDDGYGPVDVLGFHTGNLVAIELAVQRPDLVRRLVMPGIPYYLPDDRRRRLDTVVRSPMRLEVWILPDPWICSASTPAALPRQRLRCRLRSCSGA